MEPTLPDLLFLAVLVLAVPVYSFVSFPKTRRAIESGVPGAKLTEYRHTLVFEWALFAAVLVLGITAGRGLDGLGLQSIRFEGIAPVAGLALTLLAILGLWVQWRALDRSGLASFEGSEEYIDSVSALLPTNRHELRWFDALAVTAGICEEVVYRGFLFAVVTHLTNPWIGGAASVLVFGATHLYQGQSGALRAGALGLVFLLPVVLTGSLWPSIVLHALVDLFAGRAGLRYTTLVRQSPQDETLGDAVQPT